jgi:hypothetical protein
MIARIWHEATDWLRGCFVAFLWIEGIFGAVCGVGWLVGSLLAHHALSADEWQAFMESLPVIGGL